MDEDVSTKAREFWNMSVKKANAHFKASEMFGRRNMALGVPVVITTSIVATSIFASLSQRETNIWLAIPTGLLSVLAAVLSSLQTFLRFSELSSAHKAAAVSYDGVKRRLDLFFLEFGRDSDRPSALKRLEEIAGKLDSIGGAAPTIPDSIYRLVIKPN
jgi:hypothetical protein